MTKAFTEVFPKLRLSDDAGALMRQAQVARVTMTSRRDHMKIYLESEVLIQKEYVYETEQAIMDQLCFGAPVQVKIIEKFRLSGQYTAKNLMQVYKDSILL